MHSKQTFKMDLLEGSAGFWVSDLSLIVSQNPNNGFRFGF